MTQETCYMCERPRTSAEHVPPRCLFPESKDCENGEDFRKNLIKVPSCDVHNSAKSCDDEYMLITFASNAMTNEVADIHQKTKLKRILDRKPHIFKTLIQNSVPIQVIDPDGKEAVSCIFKLDKNRFFEQLRCVANGIYFHHLKEKATLHTEVNPIKGFSTTSKNANQNNSISKSYSDKLFPNIQKYGDNPDIFYYQVSSETPKMLMKLVFYRDIEFIAVFNIDLKGS
ncbi:hypothetical protein Q4591_03165 [Shewanella sp. 3_MG-2023]|uniref:hypothetical protein n=1 Tax=Shewanella sp. 3_MG-2023 TaxID=3062635 RepID=UPI0026E4339F|nr:hypothetical protein [Shewanella sp. 3_MG-2023]MDO6774342.1 hypothetical protein [Shewanella sp. 3_MG-2023]